MSARPVPRRLTLLMSLLAFLGLFVALPAFQASTAKAAVTGGDVVYQQDTTNPGIYQYKASDGSSTRILDDASAQNPDVSPDGSRIVYTSYDSSSNMGIYVMNSDGSGVTQVASRVDCEDDIGGTCTADGGTPWSYAVYNPRWSADGQWIAFSKYSGGTGIWRIKKVKADGTGEATVVSGTSSSLNNPTWAPNGKEIAYDMPESGLEQIHVVNASGSNDHRITSSVGSYTDQQPGWSPDGSKIYFSSSEASSPSGEGYGITYFTYTGTGDPFSTTSVSRASTPVTSESNYEDDLAPRVNSSGSEIYFETTGNSSASSDVAKICLSSCAGDTSVHVLTSATWNGGDHNPSPVSAAWPNSSTKTLVALGDSVAAGEGINYGFTWDSTNSAWDQNGPSSPSWMDTAPAMGADYQGCHQSGYGYPNLVYLDGGNYKVLNMACTGASAANGILGGYTANGDSVPAQLGWGGSSGSCTGCSAPSTQFDSNNPDKVLLTVGADDIDFKGWLHTCYTDTAHCSSSTNTSTLNGELSTEEGNLRLVLTELNRWAGTKSKTLAVYVTNYYNPFSTSHTDCIDVNNGGHFPGISVSGTGNALSWLMSGLSSLNANISSEVTYAQSNDSHLSVHLVDLSSVMSGHEFCTSDPWVYGPSIDYPSWENWTGSDNPAPFHPTPDGQRAIESAVSTALAS